MRWLLLAACVAPRPTFDCPRRPPLQLGFAVAHVANGATLEDGARAARKLGADTLKIYLTPNYRDKYTDAIPEVHSLVELAETPPFRRVLALPFRAFVLTTYTFSNGVDGGFLDGADELETKAEYNEVRALAEHLLKTYKGKRFIIQNWEGDWAAQGDFNPNNRPSDAALAGLRAYLAARQQAVDDARREQGERGVQVDNAAEVNALLGKEPNVADRVLPGLCLDAVSYSSWEAMAPLYTDARDAEAQCGQNMRRALSHLRARAGSANIYLGELGIGEKQLPEGRAWERVLPVIDAPIVWWQIYDNECTGGVCAGHGLLRADGTRSRVLEVLKK